MVLALSARTPFLIHLVSNVFVHQISIVGSYVFTTNMSVFRNGHAIGLPRLLICLHDFTVIMPSVECLLTTTYVLTEILSKST